MSDTADATSDTTDQGGDTEQLGDEGRKALDAFKQRARQAERENKQLASRLAELENAGKTETQRLTEELSRTKEELGRLRPQLRQATVGAAAGLDPTLWPRLQGESDEEMVQDAQKLAALFQPASSARAPETDGQGGEAGTDMNALIRGAVGR